MQEFGGRPPAHLVQRLPHGGQARGFWKAALRMSSKPTTETSSGDAQPALAERAHRADRRNVVEREERCERSARLEQFPAEDVPFPIALLRRELLPGRFSGKLESQPGVDLKTKVGRGADDRLPPGDSVSAEWA